MFSMDDGQSSGGSMTLPSSRNLTTSSTDYRGRVKGRRRGGEEVFE
jgi:hypothetical protein